MDADADDRRGTAPVSILVVEDDRDGAETLAFLLRVNGYRVTVAADGEAALRAAARETPDVVLLDIRLPRIDGWEVARRLRERADRKRPLFIAVTGCARAEDERRSAEAGTDLHLAKPVAPPDLLAVLDRFSRIPAPPRPGADFGRPT